MIHYQQSRNDIVFDRILQIVTSSQSRALTDSSSEARVSTLSASKAIIATIKRCEEMELSVRSFLASFRYSSGARYKNGVLLRNLLAVIQSPYWISNKTWNFGGFETLTGWKFTFQTYRVVPPDSPLFFFAQTGNVQGIKKLFSSRQAFVTDRRDFFGDSALHVS